MNALLRTVTVVLSTLFFSIGLIGCGAEGFSKPLSQTAPPSADAEQPPAPATISREK